MSREKQIEEIAVKLGVYACKKTPCRNCAVDTNCIWRYNATLLYNAGYRKASEVAREIFEAVDATIDLVCAMTGLDIRVFGKYAELKKKYTEE